MDSLRNVSVHLRLCGFMGVSIGGAVRQGQVMECSASPKVKECAINEPSAEQFIIIYMLPDS